MAKMHQCSLCSQYFVDNYLLELQKARHEEFHLSKIRNIVRGPVKWTVQEIRD